MNSIISGAVCFVAGIAMSVHGGLVSVERSKPQLVVYDFPKNEPHFEEIKPAWKLPPVAPKNCVFVSLPSDEPEFPSPRKANVLLLKKSI